MNDIKRLMGAILGIVLLSFIILTGDAHSKDGATFSAVDQAGIVWRLEEQKDHMVVSRDYPNQTTVTVFSNEVLCNRLDTDDTKVTTLDMEIDEIYFLFHKHYDKVEKKTKYWLQISMNKRSNNTELTHVSGDICLYN